MDYRDKLLFFNSNFLLNKREVLESFDDFVAHHQEGNNEEDYSEDKRKVLLSLCGQFRHELLERDIPSQTKNWLYYDYDITNDGIKLTLYKCNNIEFDDNEISEMSSTEEYTLIEVKCDYLTVEQYANQYGVTTTTVRQWIRRGKLRTAKKNGRDWMIPALADKPKRGFENVTYYWDLIPIEIINSFPYLAGCKNIYIYQDEVDKKVFYCLTGWSDSKDRQKIKLSAKEREHLELALISTSSVKVEDLEACIKFVPAKRSSELPILDIINNKNQTEYPFSDIIIRQSSQDTVYFSPDSEIGDFLTDEYPDTYLIPINWEFYGITEQCEDAVYDIIDSGDYNKCVKLGNLSGTLILCSQIVKDGYDPLTVCDDESADLEFVMSVLSGDGGPLNDLTGESMQEVLYIDELTIEEPFRKKGLGTRIMQEIPYLCKSLLHEVPDILAYYLSLIGSPQNKDNEDKLLRFYKNNGFQELGDSRLLYVFTDI